MTWGWEPGRIGGRRQERKGCKGGVLRGWELGEKCTMHLILVIHLKFKHFQKNKITKCLLRLWGRGANWKLFDSGYTIDVIDNIGKAESKGKKKRKQLMIVQQNEKHVLWVSLFTGDGSKADKDRKVWKEGVQDMGGKRFWLAVQLTKFGCCTVDLLNGQFLVDYYVNQIYM